jgi:hypothetical protein
LQAGGTSDGFLMNGSGTQKPPVQVDSAVLTLAGTLAAGTQCAAPSMQHDGNVEGSIGAGGVEGPHDGGSFEDVDDEEPPSSSVPANGSPNGSTVVVQAKAMTGAMTARSDAASGARDIPVAYSSSGPQGVTRPRWAYAPVSLVDSSLNRLARLHRCGSGSAIDIHVSVDTAIHRWLNGSPLWTRKFGATQSTARPASEW